MNNNDLKSEKKYKDFHQLLFLKQIFILAIKIE